MRVGLISDTHGLLRDEVFDHFEDVDLILHGGDVGNTDILTQLTVLAPVHAVFGNTDGFRVRELAPAQLDLLLSGWKVLVTHGHELGVPDPDRLRQAYGGRDVIMFGHTHRPLVEQLDGVLIVNPGAAGPARFDIAPSIAIMELEPGRRTVRHIALPRQNGPQARPPARRQ